MNRLAALLLMASLSVPALAWAPAAFGDDDDARFDMRGSIKAAADGKRVRERVRGEVRLDDDGRKDDIEGRLEGRTHELELDLDATQRGSSGKYRLDGDVELKPQSRGGDRINEDFERTRGQKKVKENRRGESTSRLRLVSRERRDNGVIRVDLRGSAIETTSTDDDDVIDDDDPTPTGPLPDGVPDAVSEKLSELFPSGDVVDSGRDRDDGYWWFEVRSGGVVYDVEISDSGKLLSQTIDDDD